MAGRGRTSRPKFLRGCGPPKSSRRANEERVDGRLFSWSVPGSNRRSPASRVQRSSGGHCGAMPETQTDERDRTLLAIPRVLERSAGDVVLQAFERLLSSDTAVTTAIEARRLLADHEDTEELTDAIQRFVAVATPVVRVALRGARFTRIPWVLVASSPVPIG